MSAGYQVELTRHAQKQYDALDRTVRRRLDGALSMLADNPRTAAARALVGAPGRLRIRVGDWRIIYRVEDARLVVLVVEVGHRREVYRDT